MGMYALGLKVYGITVHLYTNVTGNEDAVLKCRKSFMNHVQPTCAERRHQSDNVPVSSFKKTALMVHLRNSSYQYA